MAYDKAERKRVTNRYLRSCTYLSTDREFVPYHMCIDQRKLVLDGRLGLCCSGDCRWAARPQCARAGPGLARPHCCRPPP